MILKLELTDNEGKEIVKEFKPRKIKGRVFKDVLAYKDSMIGREEDDFSEVDLDKMIDIVVKIYGNQFTSDDVYDGMEYMDMIIKCKQAITEALNPNVDKMESIAKN